MELGWDDADGVRNAHVRQLAASAQCIDCGSAHVEAVSDLPDREQAIDIRKCSALLSKFMHRFFAEISENGSEWLKRAG